jgi:hypothetical protein
MTCAVEAYGRPCRRHAGGQGDVAHDAGQKGGIFLPLPAVDRAVNSRSPSCRGIPNHDDDDDAGS